MSPVSNDALAAVKRRLAEEERQRKEREAWKASPAGLHGRDFGTRLAPWILELAESVSQAQRIPVTAMHVVKRAVHKDDPTDWPCMRGEFEAVLHRFPSGAVEPGFKSTPFLAGCRCPPGDAWALVLGLRLDQDGLLSYGILPGAQQFWFTLADLGDMTESAHHFDGTRGHDQIAPGEMVVQVSGVLDTSDEPSEVPHPCSLGSFSLDHTTNFFLPLRNAEALFRATLDGFLRGQPLPPQFHRRPPTR
jgi:hypothetical protein